MIQVCQAVLALYSHEAQLLYFCSSSTQALPEVPVCSMRRPDSQGSYPSWQLLSQGSCVWDPLQVKLSRDKVRKGLGRLPEQTQNPHIKTRSADTRL